MYTITHNGKTLYDPRLPGFPVGIPKLAREANVFDTLTFTLYPGNPEYEQLDRKSSILNLYQDSALVAQFVPVYQRTVFNGGIEYKCKNILCRMEDFYYRYLEFTGTASAFVDDVLTAYNARVDNAYKITKGNIHSASVDYKTPDPKTCFSALKAITDANGGYLAPRFENGTIYLDYLQDADLPVCEQKIVFGDNMTDLFIEKDTDNCYSVLYPFGTNSDNEVVSIADVNGGVDYLENSSAVASYGRREKKLTWANVETPAELLSYAQAKLSEIAAQYYEAVSLSAVDLHYLDVNIPALSFLLMVDCVSAPHGYSHRYPATKMEIPLDEPKSESIILGTAPLSMTDRITLERQKNEAARSSYGRAISKAEKDIESHWTHVTQVTDQGMEDCFGVIGVKLDPNTHQPMKDAQGNYVWAGPNDSPAEIWGHFHRTAWQTLIANVVSDGKGNVLSIGQVSTSADGQVFITAINDQNTGTAKISANRILIGTTSGSYLSIDENGQLNLTANNAVAAINAAETYINAGKIQLTAGDQTQVTLGSIFSVDTDGYIELGATTMINGNLILKGANGSISGVETLSIGYSDTTSQTSVGTFNFRGESYNKQTIRLGLTSPFIASAAVLTVSNNDIDLNHAHSVTMTEETSGTNEGKVHAIIGGPVEYDSASTTNRESFFDIAASQTYLNGVAAARDSIQAVLIGTSSKPDSGKSAGSATEGWYYQAQTSYSGTESYTRKYGGYVYVPKYTVTKGSWNNGGITFTRKTTTGEPSTSQSVTLTAGSTTWSGNTASVRIRDYDGTNDLYTGLTVTVDASDRYYTGWNNAAGAVSYPGTASGQVLNVTLTLPNTGASSSTPAPTKNVLFRVEKSETPSANAAVTAQYSTNNGSTYTKFLRINVGNMYTAGHTAGWGDAYGTVSWPSARGEYETDDTTSMTVSAPSSTENSPQSKIYELSATQWNGNTAFAKVKTGNDDIMRLTLDATPRYHAGSASVGLASPDWGTAPSPLTDSRTVSVATTGRVDANGNADNLTQQISLQLTKDSTPGTSGYAYLGNGSESVARIAIGDWYTAGYDAGWASAYGAVSVPGSIGGSTVKASGSVSVPAATIDTQTDYTIGFTVSEPTATGNNNVALRWGTNADYTQNPVVLRMRLNSYRDSILALGRAQHTATAISDIILTSSDIGNDVVKHPYVTYSNGDVSSSIATTIDASAVYAAGDTAGYNRAANNLTTLTATSNGTYTPSFGYSSVVVNVSTTPDGDDMWLGVTGSPGYSYSSRPADTSGNASKQVGIYYKQQDGTWLCLRNGSVNYDGGTTYNKSVTLTYKGSVDGVYTWTTSTYVSGLSIGSRYTVHFNT